MSSNFACNLRRSLAIQSVGCAVGCSGCPVNGVGGFYDDVGGFKFDINSSTLSSASSGGINPVIDSTGNRLLTVTERAQPQNLVQSKSIFSSVGETFGNLITTAGTTLVNAWVAGATGPSQPKRTMVTSWGVVPISTINKVDYVPDRNGRLITVAQAATMSGGVSGGSTAMTVGLLAAAAIAGMLLLRGRRRK